MAPLLIGQKLLHYEILEHAVDGPNSDVYILETAGGKARKLTDSRARYSNPEWSCDGRFIYAQVAGKGLGTVFKIPISGGQGVPVVQAGMARETSDCQYLVYGTDWPERYRVWRRRLEGADEAKVIAEGVYPFAGFQVSPEGMYYFGASPTADGYPLLMRGSNGSVSELARVQRPTWGLSVSPDRRSILFVSRAEGASNIHMIQGFR